MFEINLIKDRIIPIKRKNVLFGLVSFYILIWTLSIAAVFFLHVMNIRMIEIYKLDLAKQEREISVTYVDSGMPTRGELKIMWNKLLLELTNNKHLLSSRVLWASKLDQISHSLPEGVWVDEIRSGRKASGPEKGKSKSASIGPQQQTLVIEGRALSVSDEEGITSVEHFVAGLEKSALFMEGIENVELISTEQIAIGNRRIVAFQVLCRFDKGRGV